MRARRSPEVIAGNVSAAGAVIRGGEYTVRHLAVGTYVIILPPYFRAMSAVASLNAGFGAGVTANVGAITDNEVQVFVATSAGAGVDTAFYFVAVSK
jgi:hypothetical protein